MRTRPALRFDGEEPSRGVAAGTARHINTKRIADSVDRGIADIPGMRIFGITDAKRFDWALFDAVVPAGRHNPQRLRRFWASAHFHLGREFLRFEFVRASCVEQHGGVLRVGLVHYNTAEEVDRLLAALHQFCGQR